MAMIFCGGGGACEKLFAKAEKYQADVTSCWTMLKLGKDQFQPEKYVGDSVKGDELLVIDSAKKRHEFLKLLVHIAAWGRLYRRDFLEKNEITFPEHLLYEDEYFTALVRFTAERIYVVDDYLYCYDRSKTSTVSTKNQSFQFDRLQVLLMTLDELCRRGYEKEFYQETYGLFLKRYYISPLEHFFELFDPLPYAVFNEMKRTVLTVFPDYKESETYVELSPLERGLLESLEVKMTNEKWELLAQNFLNEKGR